MSPKERMRRLEEKIEADIGDSETAQRRAFEAWLHSVSDSDLDLLEAFVAKMEDEPGNPHRELWLQCSSYDEAMQMIRERA